MYFVSALLFCLAALFFYKWRRKKDPEMLYLAIGFSLGTVGSVIVTWLVLGLIQSGR